MTTTINRNGVELLPSQERALASLLGLVERDQLSCPREMVFTVDLKATTYGEVWVGIKPDIPSLPAGNALRVLVQIGTWYVRIGRRGRLVAHIYPRSLDQFAGSDWCGIAIERPAGLVTIADVAREAGVDPKRLRDRLREGAVPGLAPVRGHWARIRPGDEQHQALVALLEKMRRGIA